MYVVEDHMKMLLEVTQKERDNVECALYGAQFGDLFLRHERERLSIYICICACSL